MLQTKDHGSQNMCGALKRVLMRRPGASLLNAVGEEWHYGEMFDGARAIEQYRYFAELISASGAEILWIEDEDDGLADAMFTHDPSLMTDYGAILLRMGKDLRMAEPEIHCAAYESNNIPILGHIEAPGQVEGGDCIWIDNETLVVGRGVRTNEDGIQQLRAMLMPHGIKVVGFDLPLYKGFEACLHLMSIISPLKADLALVYAPLFPVALWQLLEEKSIKLLQAPEDEFNASFGLNLNVLPTAPGQLIMVDGFPKTRLLLEEAGCHVETFEADALCIACEGGPTCLTRPVLRR